MIDRKVGGVLFLAMSSRQLRRHALSLTLPIVFVSMVSIFDIIAAFLWVPVVI